MGVVVLSMTSSPMPASPWLLMVLVGALAGFFVVPMNALLPSRSYPDGRRPFDCCANFQRNLSILVADELYALLIALQDWRSMS